MKGRCARSRSRAESKAASPACGNRAMSFARPGWRWRRGSCRRITTRSGTASRKAHGRHRRKRCRRIFTTTALSTVPSGGNMRSLLLLAAVAFAVSLTPLAGLAQGNSEQAKPHGSAFKLFGAAAMVPDPENEQNIVLRVVSDGGTPVGAYRDLRNVKIWHLDHQLSFLRAFVAPHTCGGGSPRIILFIDADGDG